MIVIEMAGKINVEDSLNEKQRSNVKGESWRKRKSNKDVERMRKGCNRPVTKGRKRRNSEGNRMNVHRHNAELSSSASERKKPGKMNNYVGRDSKSSPKKRNRNE